MAPRRRAAAAAAVAEPEVAQQQEAAPEEQQGNPPQQDGEEPAVETRSIKVLAMLSLKRTYDLFVGNYSQKLPLDEDAQKAKLACKVRGVGCGGGGGAR